MLPRSLPGVRPFSPAEPRAKHDPGLVAAVVCLTCYAVEVVRTAWLCDDAFITLRTVDNLIAGYGPRWNVAERVQTYTHPLWMLLLAAPYALTREPYFTPLLVSIALSLAAMWLFVARLSSSLPTMLVGCAALFFSKAFVDYSTSGLENPATHFLLALFILAYWRARASRNGLIAVWGMSGLLILNRLDLALLVMPATIAAARRHSWRDVIRAAAIGLAPVVAWEIFSVVYYGFPFPNSAYAKLATGVRAAALVQQGLVYMLDSFGRDPVTPLAILTFAISAARANPGEQWPLALGIALYGGYIVRVGGDFMSGRLLTPMLFCAAAMFAHERWRLARGDASLIVAATALFGVFATSAPPLTSASSSFVHLSDPNAIPPSGVGDERLLYYGYTGLLRWSRSSVLPDNDQVARGRALGVSDAVLVSPSIGVIGYFAGPAPHLIDPYGLADPLLARLPALPGWRIGHYERPVPSGYLDTLRTGRNVIADPVVAARYEQLKAVTQGPLWSWRRWRAIRALNLGG
jgi:arabinofuranosyltransferase